MKKIISAISISLLFFAHALPAFAKKPSAKIYEAAANLASDYFRCESFESDTTDPQVKVLQYEFIKNPKKQKIMQICTYGSMAFVLREEEKKDGRAARGGIYSFSNDPQQWHKKYIEKRSHRVSNLCEIQESSTQADDVRINYLCYNPTVAMAYTKGKEFSYRVPKRRTYVRDCTVYFVEGQEDECGKWKRLK